MMRFRFLDQTLRLFPQRVMVWEEANTAVIADVHFGKAATFRASGIPLPPGTTEDNLARLTAVLEASKAERLLILGDLLHAKAGRDRRMIEQVTAWRGRFASLTIDLLMGNHDQHAGRPPDEWQMRCADELVERPFVWRHMPGESERGYVVAGHVHTAVSLRGSAEQLTLPCFYFGKKYGLMPAFGDFTGHGVVYPKRGEPVFVVTDDEVVQVA